jgi:hypothetical protein
MNSTSKRSKRFHKTLNPQLNPNIGNTRFKYTRVLAVVGESRISNFNCCSQPCRTQVLCRKQARARAILPLDEQLRTS